MTDSREQPDEITFATLHALMELRQRGVLSPAEYEQRKTELLEGRNERHT